MEFVTIIVVYFTSLFEYYPIFVESNLRNMTVIMNVKCDFFYSHFLGFTT